MVSSESTKLRSRARVARQADFKGSSENVEHSDQSARRLEVNGIALNTIHPFVFIDFKICRYWHANKFRFQCIRIGAFVNFTLNLQVNGLYGPGTVMDRAEQLYRALNSEMELLGNYCNPILSQI